MVKGNSGLVLQDTTSFSLCFSSVYCKTKGIMRLPLTPFHCRFSPFSIFIADKLGSAHQHVRGRKTKLMPTAAASRSFLSLNTQWRAKYSDDNRRPSLLISDERRLREEGLHFSQLVLTVCWERTPIERRRSSSRSRRYNSGGEEQKRIRKSGIIDTRKYSPERDPFCVYGIRRISVCGRTEATKRTCFVRYCIVLCVFLHLVCDNSEESVNLQLS